VKSLDERLAEQETKSSGIAQRLDRVDVRLDDGAIVVLGLYQTVFHHDYVVRWLKVVLIGRDQDADLFLEVHVDAVV